MLLRVRSLRPSRAAAVARLGRLRHVAAAAAAATAAAVTAATALQAQSAPPSADVAAMALKAESEADVRIENWSGTHTASPSLYFQPDTPSAVERIVALAHAAGARLRVVGSKISPNGIGLSDEAMLDMAQLDAVLSVDVANRTATVQAGVRVREVVEALRPHGLTLQNYASIAEQQIGGFLQVGAHGTGAGVPPVDEQVIRMVLQTPALGRLELSPTHNPALFHLAKVGLGWLGVVTEVTLQCVPAHKLLQHTFVLTRQEVVERHLDNLRHQHMRYMWLPHTDTVVVVTCDPVVEGMALPPPPTASGAPLTLCSHTEKAVYPSSCCAASAPLRKIAAERYTPSKARRASAVPAGTVKVLRSHAF
jgi:L-galactono-1,4-lactone dehydrogenase